VPGWHSRCAARSGREDGRLAKSDPRETHDFSRKRTAPVNRVGTAVRVPPREESARAVWKLWITLVPGRSDGIQSNRFESTSPQ